MHQTLRQGKEHIGGVPFFENLISADMLQLQVTRPESGSSLKTESKNQIPDRFH